jgi:hypothetical protein
MSLIDSPLGIVVITCTGSEKTGPRTIAFGLSLRMYSSRLLIIYHLATDTVVLESQTLQQTADYHSLNDSSLANTSLLAIPQNRCRFCFGKARLKDGDMLYLAAEVLPLKNLFMMATF